MNSVRKYITGLLMIVFGLMANDAQAADTKISPAKATDLADNDLDTVLDNACIEWGISPYSQPAPMPAARVPATTAAPAPITIVPAAPAPAAVTTALAASPAITTVAPATVLAPATPAVKPDLKPESEKQSEFLEQMIIEKDLNGARAIMNSGGKLTKEQQERFKDNHDTIVALLTEANKDNYETVFATLVELGLVESSARTKLKELFMANKLAVAKTYVNWGIRLTPQDLQELEDNPTTLPYVIEAGLSSKSLPVVATTSTPATSSVASAAPVAGPALALVPTPVAAKALPASDTSNDSGISDDGTDSEDIPAAPAASSGDDSSSDDNTSDDDTPVTVGSIDAKHTAAALATTTATPAVPAKVTPFTDADAEAEAKKLDAANKARRVSGTDLVKLKSKLIADIKAGKAHDAQMKIFQLYNRTTPTDAQIDDLLNSLGEEQHKLVAHNTLVDLGLIPSAPIKDIRTWLKDAIIDKNTSEAVRLINQGAKLTSQDLTELEGNLDTLAIVIGLGLSSKNYDVELLKNDIRNDHLDDARTALRNGVKLSENDIAELLENYEDRLLELDIITLPAPPAEEEIVVAPAPAIAQPSMVQRVVNRYQALKTRCANILNNGYARVRSVFAQDDGDVPPPPPAEENKEQSIDSLVREAFKPKSTTTDTKHVAAIAAQKTDDEEQDIASLVRSAKFASNDTQESAVSSEHATKTRVVLKRFDRAPENTDEAELLALRIGYEKQNGAEASLLTKLTSWLYQAKEYLFDNAVVKAAVAKVYPQESAARKKKMKHNE